MHYTLCEEVLDQIYENYTFKRYLIQYEVSKYRKISLEQTIHTIHV